MSWRTLLSLPARRARGVSLLYATRSYSLRSNKIQAIVHEHKKTLEKDRDLILKVMGTLPSPREARQFLTRFSSPDTTTIADLTVVDKLLWPKDHLALIKLEGPFDAENLASIAQTLVQLQRLGLMSVVMLDNQTWWSNQGVLSDILLDSEAEQQVAEIRRRMMKDMTDLVEEIERSGGKARPVFEGIFEETDHRHDSIDRIVTQDDVSKVSVSPGLQPIRSCLRLKHIPVMIPIATTTQSHRIPIQSNKALVALAKYMGETAADNSLTSGTGSEIGHETLVPMRLIVINTTGGIPLTRANGIRGPTHCFVNLKDEYHTIVDDLNNMNHIPEQLAQSYQSDLDMIKESLEHLPLTCSALITSSPSLTLITNLITDKPLFSSTMREQDPKVMLATTVLRNGLDIFTFRGSLQGLDLKRLQGLLESSFGKSLDAEGFFARIEPRTRTVILAGQDYMGAAIVTREGGNIYVEGHEQRTLASVAYLDKFSIAPKSQGIGVADILWKKLTDEFPDLVWRSRTDNPVNKWYFDRADGYIRIPGTNWTVFWYGQEGLKLMRDYIQICRDIPASFSNVPLKRT